MPNRKHHVARKRFGQHFLVDRAVIAAIVRAIAPAARDTIVEIGPGLGALTEPLVAAREAWVEREGPLEAVELDRDLVARLGQRFDATRLRVHEADALGFDFASLAMPDRPLRIVGNLPYNISSPLLFHLVTMADAIHDQHFMLQKEVVDRIVAAPGTADYGRLSVMLQVRYDVEALFDVAPEAFSPPPAVVSSVVRMTPLRATATMLDFASFSRLVSLAFSQRRKMLRNTLVDFARAMERVGVAGTSRAEEIPVETYIALANEVARDQTTRTEMSGKPSM